MDVDGMQCRPIYVEEFNVTILEATAEQQDILVGWALMEDDDDDNDSLTAALMTDHPLPSGDPYGAVLWPAARTLARHIVGKIQGKRVWEVGVGTGLVSMAVAQAGASYVYATDYETVPLQLLTYAATHINGLSVVDKRSTSEDVSRGPVDESTTTGLIETSVWDVCNCSRQELPDADIMVVADLLYEPPTGVALAHLVVRALQSGISVVVADSPGRAGRPAFLETLRPFLHPEETSKAEDVDFVTVVGSTVTGKRNDLICGRGSTSVSATEKPLPIALLELDPSMLAMV